MDSERPWEPTRVKRRLIALWLGLALTLVGLGELPASQAGAARISHATQIALTAKGFFAAHCPAGSPIARTAYDLGPSFAGLRRGDRGEECNPALRGDTPLPSGPRGAVGYFSESYGSCTNLNGDGCSDPLEVQSWPECAHDPKSLSSPEGLQEGEGALTFPADDYALKAAPWIPATSLYGGLQIEIYTGATTIVVFSNVAAVGHRAAEALAATAAVHSKRSKRARLLAAAGQPGDASTCIDRLPRRR